MRVIPGTDPFQYLVANVRYPTFFIVNFGFKGAGNYFDLYSELTGIETTNAFSVVILSIMIGKAISIFYDADFFPKKKIYPLIFTNL